MAGTSPRVDQRSLHAGTTARFAQLIMLVLIATPAVSTHFISTTDSTGVNGCMLAAGVDLSRSDNIDRLRAIAPQQAAFDTCLDQYASLAPWWLGAAWIGLVLIVAAFLFAVIPAWRTRPGRVVPLDTSHVSLVADLAKIARSVGTERRPLLYLDRAAGSANAIAFGSDRRPILLLDAGLLLLRAREPERFKAILRHEFAHIANRDITVTYATIAIWRAFLLATAAPFLVWIAQALLLPTSRSSLLHSETPFLLQELLFVVVLSVLLYLARSDVLRTREICADIASHRDGAELAGHVSKRLAPVGRLRRAVRSFVGLWRVHPPWDLRGAAVDDPSRLHTLSPLPMFLIGLATGLIGRNLDGSWLLQLPNGVRLEESLSLVPAALVAGTVGIAIWNAVTSAPTGRRPVPSVIVPGMFAGAGLAVAAVVHDHDFDLRWFPDDPVYLVLPVLAGAALFWWTAQCARLWYQARSGRVGLGSMMLVLTGAALLAASGLSWWFHWGLVFVEGWPYSFPGIRELYMASVAPGLGASLPTTQTLATGVFVGQVQLIGLPFSMLGVTAAWAVPLLALASWSRATSPEPVPLRRIAVTALVCGLLSCGIMLAVELDMPNWQVELEPYGGLSTAVLVLWILLALGASALTAAVVAGALVRRYRLAAAVIAAHLAVMIGLAGTYLLTSTVGCVQQPVWDNATCIWIGEPVWAIYRVIVGPVLLATSVVAVAAAALVAMVGRLIAPKRRSRDRVRVPSGGRRRAALAPASAVALCAVMAGVAFGADARPINWGEAPDGETAQVVDFLGGEDGTPSRQIQAMQLAAWGKYGGEDLLERFVELPATLAAAFEEVGMSDPDDVDLSPIRDACVEFTAAAEDARRYFRLPDLTVQAAWGEAMADLESDSRDCVQGIDSDDPDRFYRALDAMYGSMLVVTAVVTELSILIDDFPE